MPPAKSSRNLDDSKSEGPNPKEKSGNGHSSTKMRRGASQQNHSHLREVTNAAAIPPSRAAAEPSPPGVGHPSPVFSPHASSHHLLVPTGPANANPSFSLSYTGPPSNEIPSTPTVISTDSTPRAPSPTPTANGSCRNQVGLASTPRPWSDADKLAARAKTSLPSRCANILMEWASKRTT
ncbi:hypothetical protein FZEAL_10523 [Fusarium zealandicum]|uniref:Uncharacterized protein n=1 Tax=Fusarium zealandicum TaxID=1053134 RepID=A0A8H4U121_9HYPO|nr:hypothetical protein FZEAL_10523 [Fusarium zealandicum]